MKRIFLSFLILCSALSGFAQVGNEWIQFGQEYYKIPVAKDGIYKIPSSDLMAKGLPSSIDPKKLQLFHRGVEQAILVAGEEDGTFDNSDYIEFFGMKNDGTLDAELYLSPSLQPHKYYNIYNDTTSYFLTYGSVPGKRIALSAESSAGMTGETFHWDEKLLVLTNQYSTGVDFGSVQQTVFDVGEGWTGPQLLQNQTGSYVIDGITQRVTSGGNPVLEVEVVGRGPMPHVGEMLVNGRSISSISFTGFEHKTYIKTLEWTDIGSDGKLTVAIKVYGEVGQADRFSVSYIKLRYPQQYTMANSAQKVFVTSENATNSSYLKIQSFLTGTRLFDITVPSSVVQVATSINDGTLNAVVTSTSVERKILSVSTTITPKVSKINFRQINPQLHDFIIIAHPFLRQSAGGYSDPVTAYAEYRASPQGGEHDTLTVNIDQLYNQFSYGEQTPLAIFHFMKFLASIKLPQYLFIIGKGLDVNIPYYRKPASYPKFKDFVPTAGYPGSDAAFSAGLGGVPHVASVATGRLTAINSEEVAYYLTKVKETEARAYDDLRRKKILHLSGGTEEHEPALFRLLLEDFQRVAESFYLGANISAVAKQTLNNEVINVAEEVNKGLGMITFFGHSAPTTQDFDIGYVTDVVLGYNNVGKYPFILMNGCNAGSIFVNGSIFAENWVNTPNKGAIGLVAHSAYGLIPSLYNYSSIFYQVAFGDETFINKGVGVVQQEVAKRYLNTFGDSETNITQIQQMMLLGDPALRIFGAQKPDYEINESNVSIESGDGEPITASSKEIKLNIVVRNFGVVKNEEFRVEVLRKLNDNSIITYDSIYNPVLYTDTLTFIIKNTGANEAGNNSFTIKLDADELLDELNESNNATTLEYFIPLSGSKNLYPNDFAIINKKELALSLQFEGSSEQEREFLVEMDTVITFNSAFKKEFSIMGRAFANQDVELLTIDSLAYYWRTRLAHPADNESDDWDVSSFTYINDGAEGWAQVDFSQFFQNATVGLTKDTELKKLRFKESKIDVAIRTFASAANKPRDSVSIKVNGAEYNLAVENAGVNGCRINTINLVAFDRSSTQPYPGIFIKWYEINNLYGKRRLICGREPYIINSFTSTELVVGHQPDLIQYVDNVHLGDSVVLFNIGDAKFESWPVDARNKLGELGISVAQLSVLTNGEAVVIYGRKGAPPGTAQVYRIPSGQINPHKLEVTRSVTGGYTSGSMQSTLVGPARAWHTVTTRYSDVGATDQVSVDIEGIKYNGTIDILRTGITNNEDISTINPLDYPYIKLVFKSSDDIELTPVQLDKWLVTYEGAADGAIVYLGDKQQASLYEGERWIGKYGFVNISDKPFSDAPSDTPPETLIVTYKVVNPSQFKSSDHSFSIVPPQPGDTVKFTIDIGTVGMAGLNNVEVFVNPYTMVEQNFDNNVMVLNEQINVIADKVSPLLYVTVDDRYLQRDDFVSKNPDIKIGLWDNNRHLIKKDTVGLNILWTVPCDEDECTFKRINFSQVTWTPASDTSDFSINFKPGNLAEGKYVLRVEASDATGNLSGIKPYEISFQVKYENTVDLQAPFPNPFTNETNFRFVITGDGVPESYSIEVFELNGHLIKQIKQVNTGKFHIGTNTIRLSATDHNGFPLPKGVYLYKIGLTIDGKVVEKRGKLLLTQ
jgi:hypothetical protein